MFERRGELNKGKDLFLEMDVTAKSKKEAIGIGADQGADKERKRVTKPWELEPCDDQSGSASRERDAV
jgi:hypothetical protein